jgi:hypothetical protein
VKVSACIYHASYRQWLLPKGPLIKGGVLDNAISKGGGGMHIQGAANCALACNGVADHGHL